MLYGIYPADKLIWTTFKTIFVWVGVGDKGCCPPCIIKGPPYQDLYLQHAVNVTINVCNTYIET